MTNILIYCDIDEGAFELLSWGKKVKDSLHATISAVLLGKGAKGKAADYFAYGADKVYWSEQAALTDFYADVYADALFQIANANHHDVILIGSTRR